ncbi:hypothetical protein Mm0Y_00200 [Morganella morganii]|nr:hypothetical protein Mm0Y_00200 [Morganella morganii]
MSSTIVIANASRGIEYFNLSKKLKQKELQSLMELNLSLMYHLILLNILDFTE